MKSSLISFSLILPIIFATIPQVNYAEANPAAAVVATEVLGEGALGLTPAGWTILAAIGLYAACPGTTPQEKAQNVVNFFGSLRREKLAKDAQRQQEADLFLAENEALQAVRRLNVSNQVCENENYSPEILRFAGSATLLFSQYGVFRWLNNRELFEKNFRALVFTNPAFMNEFVQLLNRELDGKDFPVEVRAKTEGISNGFKNCLKKGGFLLDFLSLIVLGPVSLALGLALLTSLLSLISSPIDGRLLPSALTNVKVFDEENMESKMSRFVYGFAGTLGFGIAFVMSAGGSDVLLKSIKQCLQGTPELSSDNKSYRLLARGGGMLPYIMLFSWLTTKFADAIGK